MDPCAAKCIVRGACGDCAALRVGCSNWNFNSFSALGCGGERRVAGTIPSDAHRALQSRKARMVGNWVHSSAPMHARTCYVRC